MCKTRVVSFLDVLVKGHVHVAVTLCQVLVRTVTCNLVPDMSTDCTYSAALQRDGVFWYAFHVKKCIWVRKLVAVTSHQSVTHI